MNIREVIERTQALDMFWDREISKLLKLKPSAVVTKEEILGVQEALQAQRGGVSQLDMTEIWEEWVDGYKELVKLAADVTKEQARGEIIQIYGVTTPLDGKSEQQTALSSD